MQKRQAPATHLIHNNSTDAANTNSRHSHNLLALLEITEVEQNINFILFFQVFEGTIKENR
jgi:hypothetical protein